MKIKQIKKQNKELTVDIEAKTHTYQLENGIVSHNTSSLLPGVTPGIHPAYARYMIRRIRISADHSLVQTCREHGYTVTYQENFDGSQDRSTVVVEFPFRYPDNAILASEVNAISQLEAVKWLQSVWSDNSVSCTIYYKIDELPEIRKYLKKNYKTNYKSLSFLLHSEHGFKQAPIEEITKEQYDLLVSKTKIITEIASLDIGLDDAECASGACPTR